MDKRRRKDLSSGQSYTRLHGVPPTSRQTPLNTSSSLPSVESRPKVHFTDARPPSHATSTSAIAHVGDPELEEVMRHYGMEGRSYTVPPPSYPPKPLPGHTEHTQRLTAFGVSISNRLSHFVFAYPFIVLRRQCQVNSIGKKYHLTPFTIFGVALNMQRAQGLTCLWKGIGSGLVVSAMSVSSEALLSDLPATKFPREISSNSSLRSVVEHLALKTCSILIVLPFYSAHLVESVQSEMVSESPGVFSCIVEGFRRLFGRHQSPRMLPLYRILVPTLSHALLKYILVASLQQVILSLINFSTRRRRRQGEPPPSVSPPLTPAAEKESSLVNIHYPELLSSLIAEMITDIILFPVETAVNRINIQGTRTIIDNTDTGRGFLPVSSRYDGFWDCLSTCVAGEGYSGLYRGFGALIFQYSLRYATTRLTKLVLTISC